MYRPPVAFAAAKAGPILHPLEQLAFYAFAGIALPAIVWSMVRGIPIVAPTVLSTLGYASLAAILSWNVLNRLRTYARARLLSYVFPVNLAAFGVVFAGNVLLRQDFTYSFFMVSAVATLAISYLVTAKIRHSNPHARHIVVPFGTIGSMPDNKGFVEAQSAEQLETLIESGAVTGSIIADLHYDHSPEWERLLARAALKGIPVYHYRLIEESLTGEVRIDHLRENDLGSLIPNLPYRYAKRFADIASVIAFSPVLLPVIGLIAILVKMDSPGSPFYFQERVGFRGEIFYMAKLRTMHVRPEAEGEDAKREDAKTKENDSRITRVGRFLRKTRLDELPQVWNVLVGEMSLIGPRPEAKHLAEWHEGEIPFYSYRHIVRPGITGWSQVNQGHVTDLEDVQAKVRYDFYYIKNLSLWLDALIALKTVRVMISGIGAR